MRDGTAFPKAVRRRADVILKSNGGMKNCEISAKVGMSAYWVGKWIRRFNAGGIEALGDLPRSGRRGNAAPLDVAGAVRERLGADPPEGEERWTAALLADDIGVTEQSVRNAARADGITIERRRVFEVGTKGEPVARTLDVVGLYLAGDERALALAVGDGVGVAGTGELVTRNSLLAEDLGRVPGGPSLADALALAAAHATDGRRARPAGGLAGFVDAVGREAPLGAGTILSVVLLCPDGAARGLLRATGVQLTRAADGDGWWDAFSTIARIACGGAVAASELESALRGYLDARTGGTEAFVWRKVAVPSGPEPTHAHDDGEGGAAGVAADVGKGDDARGDAGGNASRREGNVSRAVACGGYTARLTVELVDEGGNAVSASSVEVHGLADPTACDLTDRASVEGLLGDMEHGIMPAIDRAGRLLGEAMLAGAKKN